jgi:hypothetical protein
LAQAWSCLSLPDAGSDAPSISAAANPAVTNAPACSSSLLTCASVSYYKRARGNALLCSGAGLEPLGAAGKKEQL